MTDKKDGGEIEFLASAEQWEKVSTEERVQACLRLAQEAQQLAAKADEDCRDIYLELATQWVVLATEIHQTANLPHLRACTDASFRFS